MYVRMAAIKTKASFWGHSASGSFYVYVKWSRMERCNERHVFIDSIVLVSWRSTSEYDNSPSDDSSEMWKNTCEELLDVHVVVTLDSEQTPPARNCFPLSLDFLSKVCHTVEIIFQK